MKKFDLPPGFYKIQKSVYNAYGAKHSRSNHNEIKLLRVVGNGKAKRYYINEDLIGKEPSDMPELNDYEIVSEYAGVPTIRSCSAFLVFQDGSGTTFKFEVKTPKRFQKLLEHLPFVEQFLKSKN